MAQRDNSLNLVWDTNTLSWVRMGQPVVDGGTIVVDTSNLATGAKQDTGNNYLADLVGLEIPAHDYLSLSYTGSNLTGVVYKTGGASGTTVATLTLGYDGSNNLTSVTKS